MTFLGRTGPCAVADRAPALTPSAPAPQRPSPVSWVVQRLPGSLYRGPILSRRSLLKLSPTKSLNWISLSGIRVVSSIERQAAQLARVSSYSLQRPTRTRSSPPSSAKIDIPTRAFFPVPSASLPCSTCLEKRRERQFIHKHPPTNQQLQPPSQATSTT